MLRLKNIVKDYVVNKELTVRALKGVSVDFRKNEFVSILGASGCGKTTLLNIIGGLDRYTTGDLEIDGVSTKNYSEKQWNEYRNERVGFVFQSYNLIPHQKVVENVELALTLSGISKAERRKRAIDALTEVGLEKEIYKKPNQLSGGQMQRVALARALVNNPKIVLADEPTGALDSVTSLQVMDLLKKVAQNHLVIMVTHNAELAEKYSTRTVKLHDGEIISDSNPYAAPQKTPDDAAENTEKPQKKQKRQKKKRVGMTYFTALSLSFKNLLTKKGRTIMTSVAGSIGIIGVALVLALSNGFNQYITKLQSNTLSGYPITISQIAADTDAIYEQMMNGMGGNRLPKYPENDNNVHVYDNKETGLASMIHHNYIDGNYFDYIDKFYKEDMTKKPSERLTNDVQYSYASKLNVITQNNGEYVVVKHSLDSGNDMMAMMGQDSSVFQEALNNSDFVLSQYDVLYGTYPKNANQLAVIVDSRNRINTETLDALGISYDKKDEGFSDIPFETLLNKEFKLVYNNGYFVKGTNSYSTLDTISDADAKQTALQEAYNNDAQTETLTICGVLRVKEDAPLSLYQSGLLYLPSLTQKYLANSKTSQIANDQSASRVYVNNNGNYVGMPLSMLKMMMEQNGYKNVTDEQAMQFVMQQFGASDIPTSIYVYPKDFDSKDEIVKYLSAWNETEEGKTNKIIYTDATQILSSSMGQMVDIISYVLIAFASISLVVSSVMIGIITYVSVIERTKEIGVLRSLGASKNDVSNVFNAESFLIGLTAGLIGIAFTYLLCIPINAILRSVAGSALTTNLAMLNPVAALVMVAISCLLTLLAGSIPSRFAAKLDPVKALRSE
ncbi:MAG: ATP-binding cassette domain-containing protein [Corallococcus sp.]|nr:ATP-binding cassette domain-containing protein [Corallococcus sp.]